MLFRLLPVPCVMKVFLHVNGLQSHKPSKYILASKTLTQKIPVYAAPERLVGDLSFSIVFFLGTVTCPYPNGPIGPSGPIRGAVTLCLLSRYSHTHTHILNLFSAAAPLISPS